MSASTPTHARTSRGRRQIPGRRRGRRARPGAQQQGQRVVADREAEDDGRGEERAIAVASVRDRRRVAVRDTSSQATSSHSRIATKARWSVCVSACVPIAQTAGVSARPSPAAIAERPAGRSGARTRSTVTPAADARRRSPTAGSSGTPARRAAGGRPTPASRAARRSGSRSGGPCPSAARPSAARRCPRTRRRAGGPATAATKAIERRPASAAARRGSPHHPSNRLHMHAPQVDGERPTTRPIAPSMPHL